MSLAAATRRAVDEHPFLVAALRADVVNYTAAARFLEVDGETEAVATALRRYAADLPHYETESADVRVAMRSGVGPVENPADAVVLVGDAALGQAGCEHTGLLATGDVGTRELVTALEALHLEGIEPVAAGVADGAMTIVVGRRDGANALRAIEDALEAVPVGVGER
ncbi:hypothetical protein ACFQGT_03915 [Natrialbaceae archaeon GCM10025810]|uniref:DUF7523 family protein n=1 Tax=Halovalidus salilacus TaxID=3075124 RepID=UPI00361E46AC